MKQLKYDISHEPQYGAISVQGTPDFSVGGKPVAYEFVPEMKVLGGDLRR